MHICLNAYMYAHIQADMLSTMHACAHACMHVYKVVVTENLYDEICNVLAWNLARRPELFEVIEQRIVDTQHLCVRVCVCVRARSLAGNH